MKKKGIVSGTVLLAVILIGILLFNKPWQTREEKILSNIMGAYAREESIGSYYNLDEDGSASSHFTHDIMLPYIWIFPDFYGIRRIKTDSYIYNYLECENPQYTLKEITDKSFDSEQTLTLPLKRSLIPDLETLHSYQDVYVLLVDIEGLSTDAYYYLDGTLHTGETLLELKKIENAEHPLSAKKEGFSKESILNELAGKSFLCEYYDIYDLTYQHSYISFEKPLEESEYIYKCKRIAFFGNNKYIERYDDPIVNRLGEICYNIYDNPNYEIVEIDEAFYNNGIALQGFALHRMIDSVEELESYKEKYAIILNFPDRTSYGPTSIVYFYLDGTLYYSSTEAEGNGTLLPMEPMEGRGVTR